MVTRLTYLFTMNTKLKCGGHGSFLLKIQKRKVCEECVCLLNESFETGLFLSTFFDTEILSFLVSLSNNGSVRKSSSGSRV